MFQTIFIIAVLFSTSNCISSLQSAETCTTDQDCFKLNTYNRCVNITTDQTTNVTKGQCKHKAIFPMEPQEVGGSFMFSIFTLFATVGGIGGGGVTVPFAEIFFKLDPKPSIALSSFSILISTLSAGIFNMYQKHPEKPNQVLIDYGLTVIMMPCVLVGSLVGTYFYHTMPDLYIQAILTLTLFLISLQSIFKLKDQLKKERDEIKKIQDEELRESFLKKEEEQKKKSFEDKILNDSKKFISKYGELELIKVDKYGLPLDSTGDIEKDREIQEFRSLINQESSNFQWKKLFLNIISLVLSVSIEFIGVLLTKKCSWQDWLCQIVYLALMMFNVFQGVKLVQKEQDLKRKYGGINICKSDLIFDNKTQLKVVLLGLFGGIVAGALGLGGGVIFNPMLLQMGVPPKVSTATGLYLITFSKVITCLAYFIDNQLQMDYSLWVALCSTIGGVTGLFLATKYMAKMNRQSIIIVALTVILIVSTFAVPAIGIPDLIKKNNNGQDIYATKSLCVQ